MARSRGGTGNKNLNFKLDQYNALQNIRHLYDIGMRYDKPKTLLSLQFS
jgi:hypothetical protein